MYRPTGYAPPARVRTGRRLRVVVLAAAALVAVATLRWAGRGAVRAVRLTNARGDSAGDVQGQSRAGACVVSPTG
jgi:hypothetical protein